MLAISNGLVWTIAIAIIVILVVVWLLRKL
jgi:cbb3-type cytochrome oxidase subunit 3